MSVYFLWAGLIILWWLLAHAPGDASEEDELAERPALPARPAPHAGAGERVPAHRPPARERPKTGSLPAK
jgi:hypothetical protein